MTVYKVAGNTPFLGYQPGEEFEADDLDKGLVRRAKERGQIKAVKNTTKKEETDA